MTSEFTAYCIQYYRLKELLYKLDNRFKNLLDKAMPHTQDSNSEDLDAAISYNRTVQAAKAKVDKTLKQLTVTAQTILMIMQYFEIPPLRILTGQIPGELEYEMWANEKDELFIIKSRELPKEPEDPNVIVIKCWRRDKDED